MSDAVNNVSAGLPPGFGVIESPSPMGTGAMGMPQMGAMFAPSAGMPGMNPITGLPMGGMASPMGGMPTGAHPQVQGLLGNLLKPSPGVTPVFTPQAQPSQGGSATLGMQAPPKGVDVTLKIGKKGKAVSHLQKQLKAIGIGTGPVDGKYDKSVAKGVKTFQKRTGMKQTGVATRKVQEKLAAKVGQTLGKKGAPAGAAAPATVYPAATAGMTVPQGFPYPTPPQAARPAPQLNATSQQGLSNDPAHPANQHVANTNAHNGDGWNLGGIQGSAMASMPFSSAYNSGLAPYMPVGGMESGWGWGSLGRNLGYTGWSTNGGHSGGIVGWFKNLLGFGR